MGEITVKVTPKAKQQRIRIEGDVAKIYVTAPPEDGQANRAVEALIAEAMKLPIRDVSIVRGATSRTKLVSIYGVSTEDVWKRLSEYPNH